MTEHPILMSAPMVRALLAGQKTQTRRLYKPLPVDFSTPCPYGKPGDRLWVRETWCQAADTITGALSDPPAYHYRADGEEVVHVDDHSRSPWRPSIYMPRTASRILLEVTDVRVQRLHDLSDDDAKAEGVRFDGRWWLGAQHRVKDKGLTVHNTPVHAFESLWNSINGEGSWRVNPWVWAITFRRVEA